MNTITRILAALTLLFVTACAHTSATKKQDFTEKSGGWPSDYAPHQRQFYVHNQIEIDAPPEVVWRELIDYASWTDYYRGASEVRLEDPTQKQLAPDSVIRWKTMGLRFASSIKEFVPHRSLAWESVNSKIRGYHVWLIIPRGKGSLLVTEEAQRGWLTFFEKVFQPNKLHGLHDEWLQGIKARAEKLTKQRG